MVEINFTLMAFPLNKHAFQTYALIGGLSILVMAIVAPFAELYLFPKLVIPGNIAQTVKNITTYKSQFISAIFCYLITFTGDIVVAWALYIILNPVNSNLSLLAAWFRFVFGVLALDGLLNLVSVFRLLFTTDSTTLFEPSQLNTQVLYYLTAFKSSYHFGLVFFSIHLVLIGYLVFKSGYIPRVMGILLILCGLGYFVDTLKPFLFPNLNSGFITITFFGELIFMLWLLIKGTRMNELTYREQT